MVRKFFNIALKNRFIYLLYLKTVLGHLVINKVAILTYNIKKTFENHDVLIILTVDIKGVFNKYLKKMANSKDMEIKIFIIIILLSFIMIEQKVTV